MAAFAQRSPQERLWLVGGVVAALLVTMIGWLLFISPQRSDTSDVNDQAQAVRLDNVALQNRISSLRSESRNMSDVQSALAKSQLALPSTSGVPAFLRTLQSLGSRTGTNVVTLTVGAPTDVSALAAGSAPGAVASTTPSPAATGAATPTTPGTGVYGLTIAAQVNGSADQLNKFLDTLQSVQPRAVLITQITEGTATATTGSSGTSLQLTMQAFVAPSSASEKSQLSAASAPIR